MKILRINHIGVVPKDYEQSLHFFGNILKVEKGPKEMVAEQKVAVDFFNVPHSRIEILTATDETSPIAKYLKERGSGIQHVALEVDNLQEWLDYLKEHNVQMIDTKPRLGAHNTQIAFVHPKATGGILVELVQETHS